ncbi:hypothetical protein [Amycolatopsis sp. YIM 10]|uniref:hypothetical protein n=1 Tax=Amycolatopsis sp. YIM 10 TaxID=2653857 RepID=UPI00128FD256|nr:hypothetical protein [Amycolatopsis sp. YIM 10]QFU89081.1 hypothetical protein YIM_19510 [Amycolatopsis sp. YIM 10]
MTVQPPKRLPKVLRQTRVVLYVQSLLSIIGGLIIVAMVVSLDAGDDLTAPLLLGLASILFALPLLVCAVKLHERLPWVRTTALVFEWITVASGALGLLMTLAQGAVPTGILSLVLGALVLQSLMKAEVREWFAGRAALPE